MERIFVTFEQAKLLKGKGFDVKCKLYYSSNSYRFITEIETNFNSVDIICSAPEQWQVIEWLRINYGIWIGVELYHNMDGKLFSSFIQTNNKKQSFNGNKTPQEAYSVAFDYILKELI